MAVQYLFNSRGNWIAFRIDRYVYNKHAKWVGWLPWDDVDVVDRQGRYLGTITDGNRLYHYGSHPYRGYPGYPGYPGYTGFAGYSQRPAGARDIEGLNE